MSEDWRERVLADYRAQRDKNAKTKTPFGLANRPLQFNATLEYIRIIDEAAKTMGVNRSTFYRRAAAVVASRVLGIDVRVMLWETPEPGPFGRQVMRVGSGRDTGQGIEDWCPHPGCNGQHLLQTD